MSMSCSLIGWEGGLLLTHPGSNLISHLTHAYGPLFCNTGVNTYRSYDLTSLIEDCATNRFLTIWFKLLYGLP